MGDVSRKMDEDKLILYSDHLVEFLKNQKDIKNLKQCLEQSEALHSQCDAHFNHVQISIHDYQKKIDMCRQKTDKAKSEVAEDAGMDLRQKELEEDFQVERLLREELRAINEEIEELECQRVFVEERRQILNKLEQDELQAQMKLSMYASVTNIIPKLDDQSKISGHIVEKEKNAVERFEFDPDKMAPFNICYSIWKAINQ